MTNVNTFEGSLNGKGMNIAIVASRFNDLVVSHLLAGAQECLKKHGVTNINVYRCPGAFEIPLVAKKIINAPNPPHGVVALGVLIRGGTIHFDLIAKEVTSNLAKLSLETGVPIGFGVLTTETIEQALERAGTKAGNKGIEAATATLEMATLLQSLS